MPKYSSQAGKQRLRPGGGSKSPGEYRRRSGAHRANEKLRRYFDLHHDQRKLYGAIAAAVMPDNVRDYASTQGFYLIKQSGDTISIEEPQGKAKTW
jgi:RecB family endonuclease NucS